MKIVVLGAGQVGATIVEALHGEHDITVIDLDSKRLQALSYRYDVAHGRAGTAPPGASSWRPASTGRR